MLQVDGVSNEISKIGGIEFVTGALSKVLEHPDCVAFDDADIY